MKTFLSQYFQRFFLLLLSVFPFTAHALDVSISFIGDPASQAYKGSKQGLDEANLQGEFLGQKYILTTTTLDELEQASGAAFILTALNEADTRLVAERFPKTPIFNLTEKSDALRNACLPALFHVIPSEKMGADAIAQYQQKNPDAAVTAHAWNDKFRKYAAKQVNNRYKENMGEPMTDEAWTGWMALKIVADAVVRTNGVDAEKLTAFLHNDLLIDGSKGLKQTFRPNGQLRQMVMLAQDGKVVGEAPVRGVSSDLDSLGSVECAAQ